MSDQSESRLAWRKASVSTTNGSCVELAPLSDGGAAVRDSKDPDGPRLWFTNAEWCAFLLGAKAGEFDFGKTDSRSTPNEPGRETVRPEPAAQRTGRRWFPRGNGGTTRTTHPGVSKPQKGAFFFTVREKLADGCAGDAVVRVAAAGLCGAALYVLWRSSAGTPLTAAVSLPAW